MKCSKCEYESSNKNNFFVSVGPPDTYLCAWELEKQCHKIQYEKKKKNRELLRKLENEKNKVECGFSCEDLKKMTKENHFKCKYSLNFEDLQVNDLQFRDASTRYTHIINGRKFKYSFGTWSEI